MPSINGVKSLQKLSIENLIQQCDNKWYKVSEKLDFLPGPFDALPNQLLEEVIKDLPLNFPTKYRLLFITPNLKQLNIEHKHDKKKIVTTFLHLAARKCSEQLQILKIYHDVPLVTHEIFLPKFSKLQTLDLSPCHHVQLGFGDSLFKLLGTFCKELRYLDASGNHSSLSLTDAGLKDLCECKHLHTLKIDKPGSNDITKLGIRMALENLPKLIVFHFGNCMKIWAELHKEDLERGQFKTYELTTLADNNEVLEHCEQHYDHSIRHVVAMCPSVIDVCVPMYDRLTDIELQDLLELKTLVKLCIMDYVVEGERWWLHNEITFDGGVLPRLLKEFGNSLTSLTLRDVNLNVNIRAMGECCPHLQYLYLGTVSGYSMVSCEESNQNNKVMFQNLEELSMSFDNWGKADNLFEELSVLCSSPKLSKLYLLYCYSFTDELIEKVWQYHHFKNLASLTLIFCNKFTKKGIDLILNGTNPLNYLYLSACRLIKPVDIAMWESRKKIEDWDIEITYDRADCFSHRTDEHDCDDACSYQNPEYDSNEDDLNSDENEMV